MLLSMVFVTFPCFLFPYRVLIMYCRILRLQYVSGTWRKAVGGKGFAWPKRRGKLLLVERKKIHWLFEERPQRENWDVIFSRHPGCDGKNYRGKNITPNNTVQTLEGDVEVSQRLSNKSSFKYKVQVARETRLLQSENENEAVLLILFSEWTNI